MARARTGVLLVVACLAAVVLITAADWLTAAGVVVGIFLSVPILAASLSGSARQILAVAFLAHVGFIVAAVAGRGPMSPAAVWIPNRVFTILTLMSSTGLALLLQRHRLTAERALSEAVHARDLNRLLMSLLAHDLRAPLVLASQGIDYVAGLSRDEAVDRDLLRELRARLGRSLRAVEVVLSAAERDMHLGPRINAPLSVDILAEVDAFRPEAEAAGKRVSARVSAEVDRRAGRVNRLVLRQTLAIAVDNAVRYAVPGQVAVDASVEDDRLVLRVTDHGPGFAEESTGAGSHGAGMGLELARSLLDLAGGELRVERAGPDGTCVAVRLPLEAAAFMAQPTRSARGRPASKTDQT